ncbi:AidA/PixA family protein [Roseivirga pacifica]|uniref:AidA/PixA family protein n=1 Tax=Roseivirga pacifica TaxID=1267423 RepID=UPI003BAA4DA9
MGQVNVLIAVDGQKLAQQVQDGSLSAGSESAPTSLGSYGDSDVFISMIAQHGIATNEQGKSELSINVASNDEIIWAMTTFGNNTDYTAYLYASQFHPNDITGPLFSNSEVEVFLPPSSTPTATPQGFTNTLYTVTGIVNKVNVNMQYTLSFILADNKNNGAVIGYFTWDPFINVNG